MKTKNYKGKIIEVEDTETRYFMSFNRATKEEADKDAKEEIENNPIINRHEAIRHTFEPTEAYPKGERFEAVFYYNRPLESYFDYGSDVKSATKYLNNFRSKPIQPIEPYAVSSVEQNMFLACLNSAIRITKAEDKEELLKKANECIAVTPYTNWSG